jgi:hypothetical protein
LRDRARRQTRSRVAGRRHVERPRGPRQCRCRWIRGAVGIISDSFACNPPPFQPGAPNSSFEEDLGTELPAEVNILSEGCPGGTDEGRAIGQIVHDVAPGSPLLFHTGFNSELDFAEGIQRLAAAGAKVIVDDLIYFDEPMYSDGMVGQAVDLVTKGGVAYYSSAGNQARQSYEDDFRGVNILNNAART